MIKNYMEIIELFLPNEDAGQGNSMKRIFLCSEHAFKTMPKDLRKPCEAYVGLLKSLERRGFKISNICFASGIRRIVACYELRENKNVK